MIVVTGTKRSGTSLWMQILTAAGLEYVGSPFLGTWEKSIKQANPNGFYESILRNGIYHATNPHPKTGLYLHPGQTRNLAVKVFIPGLVKSDHAFLYRVIGSIRPWREYTRSIRRLYSMEREYIAGLPKKPDKPFSPLELWDLNRPALHPALEWWKENYALILDFSKRRYAFNLSSYVRLQESPEDVVRPVLDWIGVAQLDSLSELVDPKLRSQIQPEVSDSPLTSEQETVFDELHDVLYRGQSLSGTLIGKLNDIEDEIFPLLNEAEKSYKHRKLNTLKERGLVNFDVADALEKFQRGDN